MVNIFKELQEKLDKVQDLAPGIYTINVCVEGKTYTHIDLETGEVQYSIQTQHPITYSISYNFGDDMFEDLTPSVQFEIIDDLLNV